MEHEVAHDLPLERAIAVVREAAESYAARFSAYAPAVTWASPTLARVRFGAKGLTLLGEVEVMPDRVRLRLQVPWLLRPLRARAIARIDAEVRRWLERAHRGDA